MTITLGDGYFQGTYGITTLTLNNQDISIQAGFL